MGVYCLAGPGRAASWREDEGRALASFFFLPGFLSFEGAQVDRRGYQGRGASAPPRRSLHLHDNPSLDWIGRIIVVRRCGPSRRYQRVDKRFVLIAKPHVEGFYIFLPLLRRSRPGDH